MSSIVVVGALAGFIAAQSPQPATAPTQPQQAMGYFVGDWALKGTAKVSPKSAAVPFSGKEHSAWVSGQYFVETHSEAHSELGDVRSTRVMEYSPATHVYTYNLYNSLGEHIEAIGKLSGNTWTWNAVQQMNGVATKARYTFTFVSPDSYSFKSEVASPNGAWVTVMQGTATRTPPSDQQ